MQTPFPEMRDLLLHFTQLSMYYNFDLDRMECLTIWFKLELGLGSNAKYHVLARSFDHKNWRFINTHIFYQIPSTAPTHNITWNSMNIISVKWSVIFRGRKILRAS